MLSSSAYQRKCHYLRQLGRASSVRKYKPVSCYLTPVLAPQRMATAKAKAAASSRKATGDCCQCFIDCSLGSAVGDAGVVS